MRLTITLFSIWAFLSPASGQVCSNQTSRGTYSVICTGYLSPAPGAPQAPFSEIAVVTSDSQGNFSGAGKISLGGNILDHSVSGTAIIHRDCTGDIAYDQKINEKPAPKLNITFHILDDGKEIRGMGTDTGATVTCNLRLMSR